jgi:hypothetical protein
MIADWLGLSRGDAVIILILIVIAYLLKDIATSLRRGRP